MGVFEKYARYYDTIYNDKDYESECDFLESIFAKHSSRSIRTILEAGCGTGGHATVLESRGYSLHAVDRSSEMLQIARSKPGSEAISYYEGDFREFDLGKTVDAVIAVFSVVSYFTSNRSLLRVFETASRHLEPGGLFIFDAWFGPTVFHELPGVRLKHIEKGSSKIIRFSEGSLDPLGQTVAVKFKVFVFENGVLEEEIHEVHEMRPLFVQEVDFFGRSASLSTIEACPYMKLGEPLNQNVWNSCFVLRKS